MEAYGMWELGVWGDFLSPAVAFLLKGRFLPPLVSPLPDLTPGSPVTACSLLAGRLVRTFTHSWYCTASLGGLWAILVGVCAGWTRMISFVGFGRRVERVCLVP